MQIFNGNVDFLMAMGIYTMVLIRGGLSKSEFQGKVTLYHLCH